MSNGVYAIEFDGVVVATVDIVVVIAVAAADPAPYTTNYAGLLNAFDIAAGIANK